MSRKAKVEKGINIKVTGENIMYTQRVAESSVILSEKEAMQLERVKIVVGYGPESEDIEIGDVVEVSTGYQSSMSLVQDAATGEEYCYMSFRAIGAIHTGLSAKKKLENCPVTWKEFLEKLRTSQSVENTILRPKKKILPN